MSKKSFAIPGIRPLTIGDNSLPSIDNPACESGIIGPTEGWVAQYGKPPIGLPSEGRETPRGEVLMKKIPGEKTARRKLQIVFVLGILCPSLVAGYLSMSAVAKRREALKRIIESQLWISGERAVHSIETSLQDHENGILSADRFLHLSTPRRR